MENVQSITKEEVRAIKQIDKNIKKIVWDYIEALYSFKFFIWIALNKNAHKKVNQAWTWNIVSNLANNEDLTNEKLNQIRYQYLLKLLIEIADSVWDKEFLFTIKNQSPIVLKTVSSIQKYIDLLLVEEIKRINQSLANSMEFFRYAPDKEILKIIKNIIVKLKDTTNQIKTKVNNNYNYLKTLERQQKKWL